jgi:hypothetical protein
MKSCWMNSNRELQIRQRLKDDFEHYARKCLKIRTKDGGIEPLKLNKAQTYIDYRLNAQERDTGKVRAIILKGRQQGCSTYTEARFYWKVTHRRGVKAFILTHEAEATGNLFDMAARYHEHCPALVKPQTQAENAKELYFGKLDSGYKVGTAGSKGTGRSQTVQYFHGSEVAFWPHAETHATGVMQAVPDAAGTEIILESTANGIGNYFHRMWQQAEAGLSEYQAIFIPWFWQDEYSKPADDDFRMTVEEQEYAEQFNLNSNQITWMRAKIAEFGGDETQFHQEYPATAALAFRSSSDRSLISADIVMAARKAKATTSGALVGGLDLARFGDDRSAFIMRHGRKMFGEQTWKGRDTMEMAGIGAKLIDDNKLDKLFIDVGGLGAGVVDRLRELGYSSKIVAVNAGSKPINDEKYRNKRAEMWGEMHAWLSEPPVQIPDSDELHADLVGVEYRYDSNQRLLLESKEDMKKRGFRSPDLGDAAALTFAEPMRMERKPMNIKTKWVK